VADSEPGIEPPSQPRTLVVIPTYQERENIEIVLRRVRHEAPAADVLIVDDHSPDGTAALAEQLGAELGQISVLNRPRKDGFGAACRAGFAYGLQRGYELLIEMDADLSHDPKALPGLIARMNEGADLVIGSRYIPGGSIPRWPARRRALSRYGNRYASLVLGLCASDATSGLRAYRADALRGVDYESTPCDGLRLSDRAGVPDGPLGRPAGRGPDRVYRPSPGSIQDVGPHRGRGHAPGDMVGPARPRAPRRSSRGASWGT
jgi:dolichol-phosphate mannosyltransferase